MWGSSQCHTRLETICSRRSRVHWRAQWLATEEEQTLTCCERQAGTMKWHTTKRGSRSMSCQPPSTSSQMTEQNFWRRRMSFHEQKLAQSLKIWKGTTVYKASSRGMMSSLRNWRESRSITKPFRTELSSLRLKEALQEQKVPGSKISWERTQCFKTT